MVDQGNETVEFPNRLLTNMVALNAARELSASNLWSAIRNIGFAVPAGLTFANRGINTLSQIQPLVESITKNGLENSLPELTGVVLSGLFTVVAGGVLTWSGIRAIDRLLDFETYSRVEEDLEPIVIEGLEAALNHPEAKAS